MAKSLKQNTFKLLAIRPLEDTSPDLIKGLKDNYIYQFYNEYRFFDVNNNELNNNGKYIEISSIKYTPIVPLNLYSNNINISAIVGQNGSGKSSLMELFYYAILLCNKEHLDDKDEFEHNLNAEVILFKAEFIQIIKVTNKKTEKKIFIRNEKGEYINNKSSNEVDFDFYNNVLNYSIYGLNSNFIPWIDTIFYKNDAYQLPIVINPFKEYGNYDINREYLLMQSRAVFYTYVLGFKEIIKNIYIDTIHFEIDINKIIEVNKEHSTYDLLEKFFEITITEDDFNKIVFDPNSLNNIVSLSDIKKYNPEKKNKNDKYFVVYSKEKNIYKAFTYLYIFKKLFKISKTYKKYKKYHFLFSDTLSFDFEFNDVSKIIHNQLHKSLNDINNIEIIYETIVGYLDIIPKENSGLSKDELFDIKELFMQYYSVSLNNINEHLKTIKFDSNNILNNIKPIENLIQELQKDTSHITFKLKQAINYFKLDIFNSIEFNKSSILRKDNNWKINVSIDKEYFKGRTKIEDIPLAVFNHIIQVVKTEEKDETKRTELIQNGELKPYPYTSMSSGEQHLVNSILTIAYHNYNLLSVRKDDVLKKYKNINLIFDELELYLHPEYQRVYINNLIDVLNKIQNITKHKDICYNILMVTHSPFILSDIPSQNILKLKNGAPQPIDDINSFGANIHDLLADEFFLNNGSKGAYVDSIINKFMKFYYYTKLNLLDHSIQDFEETEEQLGHFEDYFRLIGDPILKSILENNIIKLKSLLLNEKV